MKIQLDTTNKIIKIEESINLWELVKTIKKLLPDNLWKEYSIEANIITYWTNPIVIDTWKDPYPWNPPYYTTGGYTDVTCGVIDGVYCIETNIN